jgi:hypothetical protein
MVPNRTRLQATSWLAAVLLLVCAAPLLAQNTNLALVSQIGTGCDTLRPLALQQDSETRLRASGIATWRLSTSRLTAEFDCTPVAPASRTAKLAIRHCLNLSELAAAPGHANGMTIATTWKQCQSYTCAGRQCAASASTAQVALVDGFLSDYRKRRAAQTPTPQPPAGHRDSVASLTPPYPGPVSPLLNPNVIFYLLYILLCIAVLARWEWARSRTL